VKAVGRIFVTGLLTVLPVAVTVYILYWLGSTAENLFSGMVRIAFKDFQGVPGVGIAVGFAIVFAIGLLMKLWVIRSLFAIAERILRRIPLVKTLYGSIRDLMGFFGSNGDKKQGFRQVVLIKPTEGPARVLGILTREELPELPPGPDGVPRVAVYLPMSYQIGGFTAIVPRSEVEPVDLSVEDALRFAVTAGMSS
jgi:uncharacterized membrane protein